MGGSVTIPASFLVPAALAAALSLGGCWRAQVRTFGPDGSAERPGRVLVLPVFRFDIYGGGADDPCLDGALIRRTATGALAAAIEKQAPFAALPLRDTCAALGAAGFIPARETLPSTRPFARSGLSLAAAREAARALGADALLLSAAYEMPGNRPRPGSAAALRLVDSRSGRLLWAAAASTDGRDLRRLFGEILSGKRGTREGLPPQGAGPTAIAILPAENAAVSMNAPGIVRRVIGAALLSRGYLPVLSPAQDQALAGLGVTDAGHLKTVPPARIAGLLGTDALLYPEIEDFSSIEAGLVARRRVALSASMVDAGGTLLWRASGSGQLILPMSMGMSLAMGAAERALDMELWEEAAVAAFRM
ncbi:MAG: GNA1162 family protein, partial [Elusimicrobiota bacterium]